MKLELTQKEYETLLHVLYMADWMLHAYETEKTGETQEFVDLQQKIMSQATTFESDDLVEWDEDLEQYFHTRKFEAEGRAQDLIDKFEEQVFWDELVYRLAKRDMVKALGEGVYAGLDVHSRLEREDEIVEMYLKEFDTKGVQNLYLVR